MPSNVSQDLPASVGTAARTVLADRFGSQYIINQQVKFITKHRKKSISCPESFLFSPTRQSTNTRTRHSESSAPMLGR